MRFFIILCLLVFPSFKAPKYEKLLDKLTAQFAKEMKKEKGIRLCAYGGRMMNDIEQVHLSFELKKKASIEEIRKLYIEVAGLYLDKINNDVALRPYLHNYPCTIENLALELAFYNEDNDWHNDGSITFVLYSNRKGRLIYSVYDPKEKKLCTAQEEPYAEAVERVKGGRS